MHEGLTPPAGAADHFQSAPVLQVLQQQDDSAPAVRVGDQYIVSLPIVSNGEGLGMMHIGVGGFAQSRAAAALAGLPVKFGKLLHPSPASPAQSTSRTCAMNSSSWSSLRTRSSARTS